MSKDLHGIEVDCGCIVASGRAGYWATPSRGKRVGTEGSWVVNTVAEHALKVFVVVLDTFTMGNQVCIKGEGSNKIVPGDVDVEHGRQGYRIHRPCLLLLSSSTNKIHLLTFTELTMVFRACLGDRDDEGASRFPVMKAGLQGVLNGHLYDPITPLAPASVSGWVSLWIVAIYVSGLGWNGITKKVMMSVDQHCWETRAGPFVPLLYWINSIGRVRRQPAGHVHFWQHPGSLLVVRGRCCCSP